MTGFNMKSNTGMKWAKVQTLNGNTHDLVMVLQLLKDLKDLEIKELKNFHSFYQPSVN